jgi:hypothetical protein
VMRTEERVRDIVDDDVLKSFAENLFHWGSGSLQESRRATPTIEAAFAINIPEAAERQGKRILLFCEQRLLLRLFLLSLAGQFIAETKTLLPPKAVVSSSGAGQMCNHQWLFDGLNSLKQIYVRLP